MWLSFLFLYCVIFSLYLSFLFFFFFFKQKTPYELRISVWSSDVCSSDLSPRPQAVLAQGSGPHGGRDRVRGSRGTLADCRRCRRSGVQPSIRRRVPAADQAPCRECGRDHPPHDLWSAARKTRTEVRSMCKEMGCTCRSRVWRYHSK